MKNRQQLLTILFSLFTVKIFAACSPHVGDATINEIYKQQGNNGDAFVEFKLLDTSINSSEYNNWKLKLCYLGGNGIHASNQCETTSVSQMDDTTEWIWADNGLIDRDYLNFKDGFDAALLDENDDFIDYIQIQNYDGQNFTSSCGYNNLSYVFTIPNSITNGTVILFRAPDGTGSWIEDKNTSIYPQTPGARNSASIDHFEILHDGNGLTCEAENITINACSNADCSTLYADAVDVVLKVNGVDDKTVTVAGGSTATSFSYTNTSTPATLSLEQTYECENGGSSSCDVVFTDAGFRFLYDDGADETNVIANQVSGEVFTKTLKLQAVENSDGVCTGLFNNDVDVELAQENISPSGTAGLSFKINGISGADIAKYPSYSSAITLDFEAGSKAIIPTPVYLDAGQIRLQAKYSVGDVNLVGSSNYFWVSPKALQVTAKSAGQDINGALSDSTIKHQAGEVFDFTVTAVNALGDSTLNYSPGQIQLKLTRLAPSSSTSANGSFSYGTGNLSSALSADASFQSVTLPTFTAGVSETATASFSEVGILNLVIQDNDYGGANILVEGEIINIGRFIPHHFKQTVIEHGSLTSVCNQNLTTFAYTGQTLVDDDSTGAVGYLMPPIIELTAQNKQNETTENYTEVDFNKLTAQANFITVPLSDSTTLGQDGNLLPVTATLFSGALSRTGLDINNNTTYQQELDSGIQQYQLSESDHFFYPRNSNALVIPFVADIDFIIDQTNFIDSDGVAISNPNNVTNTLGIPIRFGRWQIDNAFGPETSVLPLVMHTQYWHGSGWSTNSDDSCLTPQITEKETSSNAPLALWDYRLLDAATSANEPVTPADTNAEVPSPFTTFNQGEYRYFIFTAPNKRGSLTVEYEIPSWLKFDWDKVDQGNDSLIYDDNPSAIMTFGIYRGNDRIIYYREVNN